jgi:predicted MPP superfamily phosphohydrolase
VNVLNGCILVHQPKNIFEAAEAGFDLQLSGHTHGGQFLPWKYAISLNQPFLSGLHKFKETQVYVSRCTGYWVPPLRLSAPSEIALIKLAAA